MATHGIRPQSTFLWELANMVHGIQTQRRLPGHICDVPAAPTPVSVITDNQAFWRMGLASRNLDIYGSVMGPGQATFSWDCGIYSILWPIPGR